MVSRLIIKRGPKLLLGYDDMTEPRVLTTDDIELIAERAADKALEKVYAEVGKSMVKKFFWAVGLVVITAAVWVSRDTF
jgi:hypothetical protein